MVFTESSSRPQVFLEREQALQVVRWRKYIDERQCRTDPACYGLVIFKTEERVQPDELGDTALDFSHLSSQFFGRPGVPTIAQDDEHRIAGEQSGRVAPVEFLK